jgi:hypothetical protein
MLRRWSTGAMTAVALAIFSALTVVSGGREGWAFALQLSPAGIELSATAPHARIALTL